MRLTTLARKIGLTPKKLVTWLEEENIEARPVWKPLHMQPLFSECDYVSEESGQSFTEALFSQGLCLPSGSNMTIEQQSKVIDLVSECF